MLTTSYVTKKPNHATLQSSATIFLLARPKFDQRKKGSVLLTFSIFLVTSSKVRHLRVPFLCVMGWKYKRLCTSFSLAFIYSMPVGDWVHSNQISRLWSLGLASLQSAFSPHLFVGPQGAFTSRHVVLEELERLVCFLGSNMIYLMRLVVLKKAMCYLSFLYGIPKPIIFLSVWYKKSWCTTLKKFFAFVNGKKTLTNIFIQQSTGQVFTSIWDKIY